MNAPSPSLVLDVEAVVRITGYEQAKRQARWFAEHGIKATINVRNQCIVFVRDLDAGVTTKRPQVRMK